MGGGVRYQQVIRLQAGIVQPIWGETIQTDIVRKYTTVHTVRARYLSEELQLAQNGHLEGEKRLNSVVIRQVSCPYLAESPRDAVNAHTIMQSVGNMTTSKSSKFTRTLVSPRPGGSGQAGVGGMGQPVANIRKTVLRTIVHAEHPHQPSVFCDTPRIDTAREAATHSARGFKGISLPDGVLAKSSSKVLATTPALVNRRVLSNGQQTLHLAQSAISPLSGPVVFQGGSLGFSSPISTPRQACDSRISGSLNGGSLQIDTAAFDPKAPALLQQLVSKLGVSQGSKIESLEGFSGGLNEGIWFLSDGNTSHTTGALDRDLVLKLVKSTRLAPTLPTEAENLLKVAATHPSIATDPTVSFPLKIFGCVSPVGKHFDLIVMKKARGQRLTELMADRFYSGRMHDLMAIFERLGACVASLHQKYGNLQHGDLHPSNIFYEEESCHCTLIDVGGFGMRTMESDRQHFGKSLQLMRQAYGTQLFTEGMRHFDKGYATLRNDA